MAKLSARIVILTGLLKGDEIDAIVTAAKEQAGVTKDEAAIKKDINWYKSYAKKELLIDADLKITDKGTEWLQNGGKKPAKAKAPKADKPAGDKPAPKKPAAKKPAAKKPAAKPAAKKPEASDDEL